MEEKNRQLVMEAAYEAEKKIRETLGTKGSKKVKKDVKDEFFDNEE